MRLHVNAVFFTSPSGLPQQRGDPHFHVKIKALLFFFDSALTVLNRIKKHVYFDLLYTSSLLDLVYW